MSELEETIERAIRDHMNENGPICSPGLARAVAQALRSTSPQCVVVKELVWTFDRVDDQWSVWHRAGHPDIVIDTETAEQIEIMLGLRSESEVKAEGAREERERCADKLVELAEKAGNAELEDAEDALASASFILRSQSSEGEV